jgi:hypothetical protein
MADRIQGLPGYHRAQDDLPPVQPQTVFPKSQGQPTAPDSTPAPIPGLPGYKRATPDATSSTAAPASQNSLLYDMFHPTDADLSRPQTWHDWLTKTYSPSASQVGSAALDDVSFGTADYLQSRLTGENVGNIRARTADAQAALGPMGPVVNALTYAIPGGGEAKLAFTPGKYLGKAAQAAAPYIGRYGAAAAEGGTAAAASSIGHQVGDPNGIDALKVAKDTGFGVAGGALAQSVGDAAAATGRPIVDLITGKDGRSSEAWNWRTRAASGDPTLPSDVANQQVFRASNDPAQPALANLQTALSQSTDPGAGFNAVASATGLATGAAGMDKGMDWVSALVPGGVAGAATKYMGEPLARGINTIDRNINVGQALDQTYPALYPNASTTDTSGWANALRQGWIGGQRSTDQAGDAQWW